MNNALKKLFSLIELIVVVVVIGILTAIVVPNVGSQRKEADRSAVESNINSLQTSIDHYAMKHDGIPPTKGRAILGKPEPLDFERLYPAYIRGLPKVKGVKHWVDLDGTVWSSRADAPTGVSFTEGTLSWDASAGAASYEVALFDPNTSTGDASRARYRLVQSIESGPDPRVSELPDVKGEQEYLVRSIDDLGLKTPFSNRLYTGYENQAPVATIRMNPSEGITDDTDIAWDYIFLDPDGDKVVDTQWKVGDEPASSASPSSRFPVGEHRVSLRVKDERGIWSAWTVKEFTVVSGNKPPIAAIGYAPSSDIDTKTTITWEHKASNDPDGDSIDTVEWTLNGVIQETMPKTLPEGRNTVSLRVKDGRGAWSAPVERIIEVTLAPKVVVGTSFRFTNAGASGRFGPSQSLLDNAYKGTPLEGAVTSQSGVQLWTVPMSGQYRIEVKGAKGGDYNSSTGGRGAIMTGTFTLPETRQLRILVGQMGSNGAGAGGGGGSFVVMMDNTPVIIAGGGGGSGITTQLNISNASTTASGKTGDGISPGAGGFDGRGGGGALNAGNSGGAGLNSNGGKGPYDSQPGFAPLNGGNGGYGASPTNRNTGSGGFGGGGGANNGGHGAGGGGYSGGGSSGNSGSGTGGGAGSFNSGTSQSNSVGHGGHGEVTFTYLGK